MVMLKVSEFIERALFDDEIGYYKTKNPIGKGGDFTTAPEISQVFGELLAVYLLQFVTSKNDKYAVVEMGAGRGTLFYDVVVTLKKLAKNNLEIAKLLNKINFNIIEINPLLRQVQQEKLTDLEVRYYESLADFVKDNNDKKIIFFANELLDCFAIDQYALTESGWRERMVFGNDEKRFFSLAPFNKDVDEFVKNEIGDILVPLGGVFEYSKSGRDFMRQLCEVIVKQGGGVVNIDYGYVKNEFVNSLQGLKKHKKYDVLKDIGEVDITAHVDFGALDKIVKHKGLNSSLVTQREFLLGLGIEDRRQVLLQNNTKNAQEINLSVDRLIKCDEMGELFKVHIIWK